MKSSLIQQTLLKHGVIKQLIQGNIISNTARIWAQTVWLMAWAADWYKFAMIEVSRGDTDMQKKNSQPRLWECKRFFKEFRGHNLFLQSLESAREHCHREQSFPFISMQGSGELESFFSVTRLALPSLPSLLEMGPGTEPGEPSSSSFQTFPEAKSVSLS